MSCNRLRLDFSLSTTTERVNFLNTYLTSAQFVSTPPTEEELDMMGKYILWGKDPETGKNGKQLGLQLETKHGTWDDSSVDSLDQLMEQPTFCESQIAELGSTKFCVKKKTFSRKETLEECPEDLRDQFITLFHEIDKTDFMIEQYELNHGKRTKEIRAELLKEFSDEELCTLREKVTHWNQYKYLKKRHQLVEMRREQYTLRDAFCKTSFVAPTEQYVAAPDFDFDAGIEVLPLGLLHKESVAPLIFRTWRELLPDVLSAADQQLVSNLYWEKQGFIKKLESRPSTQSRYFDFRQAEHVYALLDQLTEMESILPEQDVSSNLTPFLETLKFYMEQAELNEVQREILDMKLQKKKNIDIAGDINRKYGKSYTPNYISTIFCQKIVPRINDAAIYHEKVIGSIFFPEEFKTCCHCGETMLRDPLNFTRRARSNDGFSARCKKCEKEARKGGDK